MLFRQIVDNQDVGPVGISPEARRIHSSASAGVFFSSGKPPQTVRWRSRSITKNSTEMRFKLLFDDRFTRIEVGVRTPFHDYCCNHARRTDSIRSGSTGLER